MYCALSPETELFAACKLADTMLVADRQDSYGAGGGNLSLEVRAAMQKYGGRARIKSLVYGLGGKDFFAEDAERMLDFARDTETPDFDYYGVNPGIGQEPADQGGFLLRSRRTGHGLARRL